MSYIIAFVKFPESHEDYPVECYRTDISPSDFVIIRLANLKMKQARVQRISYLNWDCKGRIECKLSEVVGNKVPSRIIVGLATIEAVVEHLRQCNWVPLRPISKQYRIAVTNSNESQTANIFFRKNGLDLQILPGLVLPRPRALSEISLIFGDGRTVRHFLSQTTFNLYEGIVRFSDCFLANGGNYDRFFQSVGSSDRATNEVKTRLTRSNGGSEMSLREALEGCEDSSGSIYLSDGVYI